MDWWKGAAAALALWGVWASPAAAQTAPGAVYEGVSKAELVQLFEAVELPLIAVVDGAEGPTLVSQSEGVRFELQGANCRLPPEEEGTEAGPGEPRCLTLLFVSPFDVGGPKTARALVDRYNRTHYYGRAFEAADGVLILDFVADVGGVTDGHLVALTEIWTALVLPEFVELLTGGPAASNTVAAPIPAVAAARTLAHSSPQLGRHAGEWSPGDPLNRIGPSKNP